MINRVLDRLNCSNQTTFIRGRYIRESIVSAHEIIHSVYQKGDAGVGLKLDYEKSYDKVNWDFLLEVLEKRGFGAKWHSWIRKIVHNGSVGVTVYNSEGDHFCTGKGLRQEDPLFPILFNMVLDVLTRMLQKAGSQNLIRGLGCNIVS
jgi:hypothetical protein